MRTWMFAFLLIALTSAFAFGISAQGTKKTYQTLENLTLKKLDGGDLQLSDAWFRDTAGNSRRAAFTFVANWEALSVAQTKAVLASEFDGLKVVVCFATERDSRALRQELMAGASNPDSVVWVKGFKPMDDEFGRAFADESKLDRVPALVVIDGARTVLHASMGELNAEGIKAALSAVKE